MDGALAESIRKDGSQIEHGGTLRWWLWDEICTRPGGLLLLQNRVEQVASSEVMPFCWH